MPRRPRGGYSSPVSTHQDSAPQARTFVRRAVVASLAAITTSVLLPVAASADTPSSAPDAPEVSGLEYLMVLGLIPLGLFLVIALLAALPSMIRDKGYEPGQAWRSEPEWFGGPHKGVEAAEGDAPTQIKASSGDQGGTSGSW